MSGMVERVKKAIEDAYDNCPHEVDRLWDYCARAAIAAMREPSEGMVAYGGASLDHPSVYMGGPSPANKRRAERAWEAMIDAALEPVDDEEKKE